MRERSASRPRDPIPVGLPLWHHGVVGAALEHVQRYASPSTLEGGPLRARLRLAASRPEAPGDVPFFEGGLLDPEGGARLLRWIGDLAAARFHVPASMLARILREADPVVTCGDGLLRFEAFSACGSAYARMDLPPEALDTREAGPGTTNVDLGPALRAALAGVRAGQPLDLSVSPEGLAVDTAGTRRFETRVRLPVRWLKGFVEVGTVLARLVPRGRVGAPEALRFLRALPKRPSRHPAYVLPGRGGLRLGASAHPEAIPLDGAARLASLAPLAPRITGLAVHADPQGDSSAWVAELGPARLTLALSPTPWRGFSGEGQVLGALATPAPEPVLARVRAHLAWQGALRPASLAAELGLEPAAVASALAALATRGLAGYDLASAAWFHRVLPFDRSLVEDLHPRLAGARALLAAGKVRLLVRGDPVEAEVDGTDVVHRVRLSGTEGRCTCPWHADHQGSRGPCKHQLAVGLAVEAEGGETP